MAWPGCPWPPAENVDRRLRQVAGTLGGGDDDGSTAVGDKAAVEQMQRIGDPARGLMIREGDRVAHLSQGIHRGPVALGDCDRAELLTGGAVGLHVPPCRKGIERVGVRDSAGDEMAFEYP